MAVPKSKISKSRRGMRRSHDRLDMNTYIEDAESGELRRPHHIDLRAALRVRALPARAGGAFFISRPQRYSHS